MRWDPKRLKVCIALIIAIVVVEVGFAAMSQSLDISFSGKVNALIWGLDITEVSNNVSVSDNSKVFVNKAPTINGSNINGMAVEFKDVNPDETVYAEYTFKVENTGTIIANFVQKITFQPICVGLDGTIDNGTCSKISVSLLDGSNLYTIGSTINPHSSKQLKLRVSYTENNSQPDDDVFISNLGVKLIFEQI